MTTHSKAATAAMAALLTAAALAVGGCGAANSEPSMQTADEAAALLDNRGFDSGSAETCYTDTGEYFDGMKISQGVEGKHPYYTLYYTDSTGDVWVVYDMGGRMEVRLFGSSTWLTEHECVTDYDSTANEFYEVSGEDGALEIVQMDKVTADVLDAYEV